jgi:uncharacterized protein (TIGR02270 family)
LWFYRDQAVSSSAYTLDDLVELDERLEAHLDGLGLAGDGGLDICKHEFSWDDPGEVFTEAVTVIKHGREARIGELLEHVATTPELSRGLISALGWVGWQSAVPHLRQLLSSDNPLFRYIGIAGAAIHRTDLGSLLEKVLRDEAPVVQARALRAAGELGRVDLLQLCRQGLGSEDEHCRFWAAWSTSLLGDDSALSMLQEIVESHAPHAEQAADIVVRRMAPKDAIPWLEKLAETPENQRLAIKLAAVVGDTALVPWLIQAIKNLSLARLAGEACSIITGLDIVTQGMEGNPPEGLQSGPTDEPEDEDVGVDPDEDLPWPDVMKVTEWWLAEQRRCKMGSRCILGKPISTELLLDTLKFGTQPLRASAAMEAALLKPDRLLFNVKAPGSVQLMRLGGTE